MAPSSPPPKLNAHEEMRGSGGVASTLLREDAPRPGGPVQEQVVTCPHCATTFHVAYAEDPRTPGRWLTPVRCPACRIPHVLAFSPRAQRVRVLSNFVVGGNRIAPQP